MNELILYFALKYNGNFRKIYDALMHRERIDCALFLELKRNLDYDYMTIFDDRYPESLKKINCPPFVIFYKGNLHALDGRIACVLGTASYTQTSLEATHDIVTGLIKKSYTVISDSSLGLNQQVHSTSYNASHRSICILPFMEHGKGNRFIQNSIEKCSLVLSERPFTTDFQKDSGEFDMNRIMIGLSNSLTITECDLMSESDRGIVSAVKYALEQKKDVYCVPASLKEQRQGTNHLIQNGAMLVTSADDMAFM